ncbi:MFS transporter [Ancylobacter sp. A5.8]|uniref:MFS transporter n=1 Tax=Ancylobacter gelatini TaxID=2919920 RepID=UPI001F4DD3DA|nr:MFS transporter [Ancylobacter gelatini]MCJ8142861.1 MFS transporter [Ancylobacter gelatini]
MYTQVSALILATSLVQLANGFFTTLVALRLSVEDFNPALEGLIMSAFFVGFTVGSITCGGIIQRIGHIRGYAAFAGIVIGATLGMSLWVDALSWMALRAAIGFGCVGLFVATESWLNAKAPPAARGRIFSTYMVGTFLALALGQLLIGWLPLESTVPFSVIATLFAAALVIVSMTRAEPPPIVSEVKLPYGELTRAAPLAVLGALVAGMVGATFYAVTPAWMAENGIAQETIGLVILSAVLGGLAFQVPVGLLSDRMDRRRLLGLLATGFALTAISLLFLPRALIVILPVAALLGGFMSTLYPVCVSSALDSMTGERVVSVSGRLILVSGIGSTIGPFTGSWIMSYLDINGVLYFIAGAAILLALATTLRALARAPITSVETASVIAPQAMQVAVDAVTEQPDIPVENNRAMSPQNSETDQTNGAARED